MLSGVLACMLGTLLSALLCPIWGRASGVMTGSWDKTLKFWDLRSPQPAAVKQLPERVYDADVVDNFAMVVTADKQVSVYQLGNQGAYSLSLSLFSLSMGVPLSVPLPMPLSFSLSMYFAVPLSLYLAALYLSLCLHPSIYICLSTCLSGSI